MSGKHRPGTLLRNVITRDGFNYATAVPPGKDADLTAYAEAGVEAGFVLLVTNEGGHVMVPWHNVAAVVIGEVPTEPEQEHRPRRGKGKGGKR